MDHFKIVLIVMMTAGCATKSKRVFSDAQQSRDPYLREAALSGAKILEPLDLWAHAPNAFHEQVNPSSKPQALLNFLAPIELDLIQIQGGRGQWWLDVAYQMTRDKIKGRSAEGVTSTDADADCLESYLSRIKSAATDSGLRVHKACQTLAQAHVRQFTNFDRKSLVAALEGASLLLPKRISWLANQEAEHIDRSFRMSLEKSRTP